MSGICLNRLNRKRFRLLMLATSGVAIMVTLAACKKATENGPPQDESPILVLTRTVEKEMIKRPVVVQGLTYPKQWQELSFQTTGRLLYKVAKAGKLQAPGDTIAMLDVTVLRTEGRELVDRTNKSRAELQRLKKLQEAGKVSQREVDLAAAQLKAEREAVKKNKELLATNTLLAPQAGRLVKWFVNEGDTILPGEPVVLFTDSSAEAIARVGLSEADYHRIAEGDSAIVRSVEKPDLPLQGTVRSRKFSESTTDLPYTADIYFENPGGFITLGEKVTVDISSRWLELLFVIPIESLVDREPTEADVFLTDEKGTFAMKRRVFTGPEIGPNIIVEKGLRSGEKLVTSGAIKLKNGARILPIEVTPRQSQSQPDYNLSRDQQDEDTTE